MDQVIEVVGHPSSEGVHHEVHLFLHHLHLCDYVRWSCIYGGCGLLKALLPSSLSWSLLSMLVPSWSPF